jgi:hypothetical protein
MNNHDAHTLLTYAMVGIVLALIILVVLKWI